MTALYLHPFILPDTLLPAMHNCAPIKMRSLLQVVSTLRDNGVTDIVRADGAMFVYFKMPGGEKLTVVSVCVCVCVSVSVCLCVLNRDKAENEDPSPTNTLSLPSFLSISLPPSFLSPSLPSFLSPPLSLFSLSPGRDGRTRSGRCGSASCTRTA